MFETSAIEISEAALRTNLGFIRQLIGPDTLLSCVIKGNAYGHGIEAYVPMLQAAGVNHMAVFSADEAVRVLASASEGPPPVVMIMGMLAGEEVDWAVRNGVEFFVFDLHRLQEAQDAAVRVGMPALIHIEVETGMNRTGFSRTGLADAVAFLKDHSSDFRIRGLCTHFAGAESIANHVRIRQQLKTFQNFDRWLRKRGIHPELRHTACSAATIRYPATRMDMVRIGILQYGFWPSREILINHISRLPDPVDPLKRILRWTSQVMSTKSVRQGEFIGYGTTFLAEQDMVIATVPVGYSHGYSRSLSNQGRVLIHGQRMSVIGMVNMNMMLVDVTHLDGEVARGDEVALIGSQGDLQLTVASFGELSDQLNYELLTRLPANIPRRSVD